MHASLVGETILDGLAGLYGGHNFSFGSRDFIGQEIRYQTLTLGELSAVAYKDSSDVQIGLNFYADLIYFDFVESGYIDMRYGADKPHAHATAGFVSTSRMPTDKRLRMIASGERLLLAVGHNRIEQIVHRHFGVTPPRQINFREYSPSSHNTLSELRSVIRALMSEDFARWKFEQEQRERYENSADPPPLWGMPAGRTISMDLTANLRNAYETAAIVSLLLGVSSNVSDSIARSETQIAPAYVRRAEEFMQSKLYSDVSLHDIAEASGCTPRNLQITFKNTYGETPMRFLRRLRLEHARKALAAGAVNSATAMAVQLGYSNFGRFAKDYSRMFGELPSMSLRIARSTAKQNLRKRH